MTDPTASDPTAAPPPYVAVTQPTVPPKRSKRLAVGAAAVVAVAAGAFGVLTLSAGGGADDAGAAVENMFDAIDHEDVIGVAESLDPNERQILRPAVEDAGQQAKRVKLASDDLDLRDVAGFDIEVKGLSYTTEDLGDGITAVDLTGGTVSSVTDLDKMPFGSSIRTILDRDAADQGGDVNRKDSGTIDLDGIRLIALRSNGGWHVSAFYSIAEAIRLDQDDVRPVPDFGNGVPAKGADSPETAVREALDAAVTADVQRLVELTPPGEAAVLHDYGPLLVDASKDASADFNGPKIEKLELTTADGPDGTKVVSASAYKVSYGDDYSSTVLEYDGSCSTITSSYTYDDSFTDDGTATYGPDGEIVDTGSGHASPDPITPNSDPQSDTYKVCDDDVSSTADQLFPVGALFNGPGSLLQVVTEQHDGAWFVSPTRTILESTLGGLRDLSPEQVEIATRVIGGDYWLSEPDSFWQACGVAKPGLDVSRENGDQAYQDCFDDLPDDYDYSGGAYGFGFGLFGPGSSAYGSSEGSFDEGPSIDEPYLDPTETCYQAADGTFIEDAGIVETCLRGLLEAGTISADDYLSSTCSSVYDEVDTDLPDDATDEQLDAAYEAADQAYDACSAAGLPAGVAEGSGTAAAEPDAPASTQPAPATSVPAAESVPETTVVGG